MVFESCLEGSDLNLLPANSQAYRADNPDYFAHYFDAKLLDLASWPYLALCHDEVDKSYTWHLFCDEEDIPAMVADERRKKTLEWHISSERSEKRRRKLKIVEILERERGKITHYFVDAERKNQKLYLPDETITTAERMTLAFIRGQMKIENKQFPLQACTDTAYLIEQVLNWPVVVVQCKLQQTADGGFYGHALNQIPGTEVLADTTLEQFDPAKYKPAEGLSSTQQSDLVDFLEQGIPEIALLPSDTPIFEKDEVGTFALRAAAPTMSVCNVLYTFRMIARQLRCMPPWG